MQQLSFRAMGCQMLAVVDMPGQPALERLNAVPGWFAEWEQHLSRFRPDSELARLNGAGRPMRVSAVLWQVLQAAVQAARQSDGLVRPTLLGALEAAGYDRSFEALAPGAARTAPAQADWRAIGLNQRARTVALPAGARIDLGGIAKGWAADQAARRLAAAGPALVDAGGDIAVSGPMADSAAWPIAIENPLAPGNSLGILQLARGGVATSGRDYRRWQQEGRWQHHIIDPRTGQPAETDVLAATVVAPDCVSAEAAAKTALIVGGASGLAWIEARPNLAGLLVLEDGQVLYSRGMRALIAPSTATEIGEPQLA